MKAKLIVDRKSYVVRFYSSAYGGGFLLVCIVDH